MKCDECKAGNAYRDCPERQWLLLLGEYLGKLCRGSDMWFGAKNK